MASITSLPLHLISDILCMLGNIKHLPAALLSNRIFYTAYLDTPSLAVDILRLQLPDDLLTLALAAHASQKSIREKYGVDTTQFLTECYDKPFNALGGQFHLPLDDALRISRLNDALAQLRGDFCATTLRKLYGLSRDDPMAAALSAGELYRVSRALYRFQIYGNLFLERDEACKPSPAQKALFFGRHSPWVNEQLACIYDYLETRLTGVMLTILSATPACREVIVNGFQWGGNLTDWLAERSQLFEEQRCLSLDLPRLYKILQSSTCEEWQAALAEASNLCRSCLEEDLDAFNRGKKPDAAHGVWREEEMDKLARQVDADDATDDHPRRIWSKVYYDRMHGRFRFGEHAFSAMRFVYGLRGVGYVMWDGERMRDDVCKNTVAKAYRGDPIF
ncbi:hypothetical protein QQX98_006090 [Neonectria punicea]|uniref:F-box domain-containing protein n=1 Tax=Neonectria punicea TaxID=979145 RepID=A0ABR1H291_9HYPO